MVLSLLPAAVAAALWGLCALALVLGTGAKARSRALDRLGLAGSPSTHLSPGDRAGGLAGKKTRPLPPVPPSRVLVAAGGGLAAGAASFVLTGGLPVAAVLVGATIGWLLPGWLDKRRLVARQRRLMSDMPTVLDLLAIATASGLPLARALEMVSARHDGPFSLELRRALDEAAAGVRLARALKNLAERTGLKAARGFATAVEQATVLGAPVAQVLRLQAGAVRVQRRRQVEMLIAGLPLKLSLCTVFFFLPAIFIFVVLPNLLAFIHGKW